jgi:hypothetical protein
LPIAPDTSQLEKMGGGAPVHLMHWQEDVLFGAKRDVPATLRRKFEYFAGAADMVRDRLANVRTAEHARQILKELQGTWPGIVETAAMEVHDDQDKNSITTTFAYEIRNCWKAADGGMLGFDTIDTGVAGELGALRATQRQNDIYVGRPRRITRQVRMEMPRNWHGEGWRHEYEAPGVRYTHRLDITGQKITSDKELVVEAWSVPATKADDYNRLAGKLSENLLTIWARERFGKIRAVTDERLISNGGALWMLAMIVLLVALVRVFSR